MLVKPLIRALVRGSDFWFDDYWINDSTPVPCGMPRPDSAALQAGPALHSAVPHRSVRRCGPAGCRGRVDAVNYVKWMTMRPALAGSFFT